MAEDDQPKDSSGLSPEMYKKIVDESVDRFTKKRYGTLLDLERAIEEADKNLGVRKDIFSVNSRIEELKKEIAKKEEVVKAKKAYLNSKMEDLRLRENGLMDQELSESAEPKREPEYKVEKVKTGTGRLDDLLLGGFPFGSNVLVYGPPYTGKEIIINSFIAEGLKKGVPAIVVLTDTLPEAFREEMHFMISGYEEYEKLGLVKYVDAFTSSIANDKKIENPDLRYIGDISDTASIAINIDETAKELLEKHKYYRLGFRSLSTLIAHNDTKSTYEFLKPVAAKRKMQKAVSMYSIEKGMHYDQDIQTVASLMDGSLDFKIEEFRTYVCAKGISDVQSRAWIEYTYSKQGMAIGSFALDHIKP